MTTTILITKKYLALPVWNGPGDEYPYYLDVYREEEKLYHWRLPDVGGATAKGQKKKADYHAFFPVYGRNDKEEKICLRIETDAPCFDPAEIFETDDPDFSTEPVERCIHYHPPYGSMNDPNGMICDGGVYHMYHQHNPMNNVWGNMTWGHAVSKDLISFRFEGDVLFPDDQGTIFSGCGIKNERGCFGLSRDALLFFYTYACETVENGVKTLFFTQRMAYSTDGGKTLTRYENWELPTMEGENRDPKIFWHGETDAYIMVLYLTGNRFAILRSPDLQNWEKTCEINVPPMWECPDLLRLSGEHFAFTSADGFYIIGRFDGYTFKGETEMQKLYADAMPYAAQTFSGTGDRILQISWLRTVNKGENWHGMMTVARELSLAEDEKGLYIRQRFAKEVMPYVKKAGDQDVVEDGFIRETLDPAGRFLKVEQLF